MKVTFFDVEYANTRNKSICQIGILSRDLGDENAEIAQIDLLVNPEDGFDENCIRIHRITANNTKNEPNFKTVWNDIEKYFTNAVVIGHNVAASDLDALYKNLIRYKIEVPELYYLCTYDLAKKVVPSFAISDYGLGTLCTFFDITFTKQHNAFCDACACSDLLDRLAKDSGIKLEDEVRKYEPNEVSDFVTYIANSSLKKDIHSFYGEIKGFSLDSKISSEEKEYICKWRDSFSVYKSHSDIADILTVIDDILKDNVITNREIKLLQSTIRQHLDIVSTSMVTLTTQILNGIIKGMIADDAITEEECNSLQIWLYENNYLAGHYPFDKLFKIVESVLEDEILTIEEAELVKNEIESLINPIETLKQEMTSLKGKHVCLSGNFAFGQKSTVEKYIVEQGGIVDSSIKKTTDILVVGDNECQAYAHGNYGTKVKKAIEYNEKGSNIQISKEKDIIKPAKTFSDVLFEFIDKSGMKDTEVYKKAQLPRQMFSKIKCIPNYIPTKQNICAFAIALQLDVDQTNELLSSAGYVLSRSFEFDRILEESIVNGIYDIYEINMKMYDHGILWLGEK